MADAATREGAATEAAGAMDTTNKPEAAAPADAAADDAADDAAAEAAVEPAAVASSDAPVEAAATPAAAEPATKAMVRTPACAGASCRHFFARARASRGRLCALSVVVAAWLILRPHPSVCEYCIRAGHGQRGGRGWGGARRVLRTHRRDRRPLSREFAFAFYKRARLLASPPALRVCFLRSLFCAWRY